MARSPKYEPLYAAFQTFLERCIVGDRSLLWPESEAWTPANVADVRARMVDTPMAGAELSFEQKLQQQMRGAGPQLWRIVCDLYYVYFLPSSFIKVETRLESIQLAAQQGGLTPPARDAEIWAAQQKGFTRTSLKYHYKYAQFWLLLLFAERAKAAADRAALVHDRERMQPLLDEILEAIPNKSDRAYDMRHAILYLAFPDHYERIISSRDKSRIIETYYARILGGEPPEDPDVALLAIRERLQSTHEPGRQLDFYDKDLRDEWRSLTDSAVGPGDDEPGPGPAPPEDADVRAILDTLKRTRNVILYGPPGTGKTYLAKRAAEALVAPQTQAPISPEAAMQKAIDYVQWATFHQSYSYEDFVEGLRPLRAEETLGGVAYDVVPGVFRRICERAAKDPRSRYVLVIDEINRGNIAKILGELITLLEDDKRAGGANALAVTLPYSQDLFSVPGNLYIIGTMNSTDRSIALLDTALRRRFAFIELMPRPELLDGTTVESAEDTVPLGDLLRALNGWLRRQLDRDHQVGHSYLLKVAAAPPEERPDLLAFVWSCQILPLLQEYFYSQPDKLAELLSPMRAEVEDDPESDGAGGVDAGRLTGEDLMAALARLARWGSELSKSERTMCSGGV